ncbi:MAG TPA: hypothetical protein VFD36_02285 [Kofleriaceae bacterium]|jgi:hypothetical protein|nr:hypothetical protein [Kofleriaceae bacterium]
MKPIKSLLVLAILCAPALASAQGYYGRGAPRSSVPGGFHDRTGRLTWGFAVGLGGMSDGGSAITSCSNCNFRPLALEADAHLGGMLSPRFALMFEAQVNGQTVQKNGFDGDTVVTQGAAMIAAQFWLLPQLWIKGGLGLANLQVDDAFFTEDFGTGGALMGAIGVELLSARNFALELQGRVIEGTYNSLNDHVTSGTVGFGINWY